MKRKFLVSILTLFILSCSLYKDYFINEATSLEQIYVTPSDSTIEVGSLIQLTCTVFPIDATDSSIEWASSDDTVASVDKDGLTTALKEGDVIITATANEDDSISDSAYIKINAKHISVTALDVSPAANTIGVGVTVQLTCTVSPIDASDNSIEWTSSDDTVANVDNNGLVTALKEGDVTITATSNEDNSISDSAYISVDEYIYFVSEGSTFAPNLVLEDDGVVEWVFDDSSTSNESNPLKDYGSESTRINKLKVTPWSSLSRINIGYDGGDGGSFLIEFVEDQNVSAVDNLYLVAPYLRQWCSSYNYISELDFSNFILLDTIECYMSNSLIKVDLSNTPELKRACFEDCDLLSLDLSESHKLEDLRAALNSYTTINFGNIGYNTWHICTRDNPQISENLFNDMTNFPNIEELFIWNDNQSGTLKIPSTGINGDVKIWVSNNSFQRVELTGALQNNEKDGWLYLRNNNISEMFIDDCSQITYIDLRNNALDSTSIDYILNKIDSFERISGTLYLTNNAPPSSSSASAISSLELKGWEIFVDSE